MAVIGLVHFCFLFATNLARFFYQFSNFQSILGFPFCSYLFYIVYSVFLKIRLPSTPKSFLIVILLAMNTPRRNSSCSFFLWVKLFFWKTVVANGTETLFHPSIISDTPPLVNTPPRNSLLTKSELSQGGVCRKALQINI